MTESPIAAASRSLSDAVAALRVAADFRASDDNRIAALTLCETVTRQVEQLSIELISVLDRDGVFAKLGYSRTALAVADLLGWDSAQAARRLRVAEHVSVRASLDGEILPARLPATAAAFAAGEISLRHVEAITGALGSPAAGRLTPQVWAGAEAQLADHARLYRPRELAFFARDLITALDQDGPAPEEHEPPQANELHLTRNPAGGGRVKGQLDAPTFDAVATALGALSKPIPDDARSLPERQADALGEVCRYTLDHGEVGTCGGERPHMNVIIPLEELERRARNALLDFGGQLTPADLRMLACDARVVPIVLGGDGQPLDVGRAMRTVPAYLRRAVVARDRGCAFPGCDRPPSWCDVHHILEWELDGATEINNLVLACRAHHRLFHHSDWVVRIQDGLPEFIPPRWVDPNQQPRRKPPPPVAARSRDASRRRTYGVRISVGGRPCDQGGATTNRAQTTPGLPP